ncbi:PASTA domain-containing protein, partial [Desulfovibrio sp. OttesenSCG-928-C06]|nr:PASTA domain-containing protein [Desulfovibrio sp. OttesenSCG-928-C06]
DKGIYGAKRTASFVGMVPAEKPRYLVLVIVDEPTRSVYGSAVAAPAFREILTHTLAYNSLTPEETASMFADGGKPSDVSGDVFDAMALDLAEYAQEVARRDAEAKTAARLGPLPEIDMDDDFYARLAEPGLNTLRVSVDGPDGAAGGQKPDPDRLVPDMRGMSVRRAVEIFAHKGIMPVLKGSGGTVVRQSPAPGSVWPGDLAPGQVLDTGVEYILWLEESVS